jgi:WhiB family redox-sensing transcriptional regulator
LGLQFLKPTTWSGSEEEGQPPDQEAGEEDMSALTVPRQSLPELPCHLGDPDLWFAETPAGLERAKTLCASCPIRRECLAAALERAEPWGVWGGEIFDRGSIVSRKRPRGRPRKGLNPVAA